MSPAIIGVLVFVVAFSGVLAGMWLRGKLPKHYLDKESQDAIKLGTGLIATMTALVLGLITASTKSSFDDINSTVTQAAFQSLTLDRLLARYGKETDGIREQFRRLIQSRVDAIWQDYWKRGNRDLSGSTTVFEGEQITETIRNLTPANDSQRGLQAKAIEVSESLLQSRWTGILGTRSSVPVPFLAVLVLWQTFIFLSFGLLAPRNWLVVFVLFVCALSVGSAVFLILEMESPFSGIIRVSAQPLRAAIERLNQ